MCCALLQFEENGTRFPVLIGIGPENISKLDIDQMEVCNTNPKMSTISIFTSPPGAGPMGNGRACQMHF